jgi:EmrB/QacA subfamily drug resistance transporter
MNADRVRRLRWWTLGVLSLSLFVVSLDNTILNVALPTLQHDLQPSATDLEWIVDAYMLVFASFLLVMGSLGDRLGRRRMLLIGLVIFGVGSFASAFSGSAEVLIASRALMGFGGAAIMPSTLSILSNVFSGKERAKAIAVWAAVAGLAVAIGPVIGGYLLQRFWWGSVFLVNVPVVVIAIVAAWFLVPESRDARVPRLDLVGATLSVAGLTALVWSIIEAPSHGWTSIAIFRGFVIAAVVLGAFVIWELRTDDPMLPLWFFRNPRFSAASASIALVFFALFGVIFELTQYLQSVLGYSALEAGLRTLPVSIGLLIGSGLSTRLVPRLGTKLVVASGLAVLAGGLAILGTLEAHSGYSTVAIAFVVLGFGMGLAMAPATDSIMGSLPLAQASVGSAINDTVRMVGGALGVAVLGSILSSRYSSDMASAVQGLPAPAAHAARDSLGAALHVAAQSGNPALAGAAKNAFIGGMAGAIWVAAAIAVVGAIVALIALPARERAELPMAADGSALEAAAA